MKGGEISGEEVACHENVRNVAVIPDRNADHDSVSKLRDLLIGASCEMLRGHVTDKGGANQEESAAEVKSCDTDKVERERLLSSNEDEYQTPRPSCSFISLTFDGGFLPTCGQLLSPVSCSSAAAVDATASSSASSAHREHPSRIGDKDTKNTNRSVRLNIFVEENRTEIHEIECGLTPTLRLVDGALIVVDAAEGVCLDAAAHTSARMQRERIVPSVFFDNLDRLMFDDEAFTIVRRPEEKVYLSLANSINKMNTAFETCNDPRWKARIIPESGSVVSFGSLRQGWAFSTDTFAGLYAAKFGIDRDKMRGKLWGNNYFDSKGKRWVSCADSQLDRKPLERAFCTFCLDPIYQIFDAVMSEKKDRTEKMLKALNIALTAEDREQVPKRLLKTIMMKFLPAAETLLQMIVMHLPSPHKAQTYRAEMLYSGAPNMEDKYFANINNCDQTAPLMLYISKMVPAARFTVIATTTRGISSEEGGGRESSPPESSSAGAGNGLNHSILAIGRVFSGVVRAGQKVRIMGTNYRHGKKTDLFSGKVVRPCRVVPKFNEYRVNNNNSYTSGLAFLEEVRCGDLCGLFGVSQFISKSATIVDDVNDDDSETSCSIDAGAGTDALPRPLRNHAWRISNSRDPSAHTPIVKVHVEAKHPSDLPTLIESLKMLSRTDPFVICETEATGQLSVSGMNEGHLQLCLSDLTGFMSGGRNAKSGAKEKDEESGKRKSSEHLLISETIVSLREMLSDECDEASAGKICMSKSPNKHGRLWANAQPLGEDLTRRIEFMCETGHGEDVIGPRASTAIRAPILVDEYGWDLQDARKIWCYGPNECGPNLVVDQTRGVQFVHEIKDFVGIAWQWATREGVLCEEPVRGVRMNLVDFTMIADAIHRGGGQVIPTARRVAYGSMLMAGPRLAEPIYFVQITIPTRGQEGGGARNEDRSEKRRSPRDAIAEALARGNGTLLMGEEVCDAFDPQAPSRFLITGHLPVSSASDFREEVREITLGLARCSFIFDHWRTFAGDPLVADTEASRAVASARLRKGLKPDVPALSNFLDKL